MSGNTKEGWQFRPEKVKMPFGTLPTTAVLSYLQKTEQQLLKDVWFAEAGIKPESVTKNLEIFWMQLQKVINTCDAEHQQLFRALVTCLKTFVLIEPLLGPSFKDKCLLEQNYFYLAEELLKAQLSSEKSLDIVFLMCPDTNYKEQQLYHIPSQNRWHEVQVVETFAEQLRTFGYKVQVKYVIGDDWFHPTVRETAHDPASGNEQLMQAYGDHLAQLLGQITQHSQVHFLTQLPFFEAYSSCVIDSKKDFLNGKYQSHVKPALYKASKQTSQYYMSIEEADLESVVVDDLALFAATPLVFSALLEGHNGFAVAQEPDTVSLERFAAGGRIKTGLVNLKTR